MPPALPRHAELREGAGRAAGCLGLRLGALPVCTAPVFCRGGPSSAPGPLPRSRGSGRCHASRARCAPSRGAWRTARGSPAPARRLFGTDAFISADRRRAGPVG